MLQFDSLFVRACIFKQAIVCILIDFVLFRRIFNYVDLVHESNFVLDYYWFILEVK